MSPSRIQENLADSSEPAPSGPSFFLPVPNGSIRVFSFPVVLAALLVLLAVFAARSRINDPDLWWHLRTGEVIWKSHSIPHSDLFSFTAYGHPWIAQEWLSELTMIAAWKLNGYTGLMLWLCAVTSLLMLESYLLCALHSGSYKAAFWGGVIVWLFSTVGLTMRPHMIGYLLLVCELLILHLGRSRSPRWFLLLPLLFALWINFHSSFFLGLGVVSVVLFFSHVQFELGLLLSVKLDPEKRKLLTIAIPAYHPGAFYQPDWIPVGLVSARRDAESASKPRNCGRMAAD
jgi:hypothetical protein